MQAVERLIVTEGRRRKLSEEQIAAAVLSKLEELGLDPELSEWVAGVQAETEAVPPPHHSHQEATNA